MLKKTITFEDLDGNSLTQDFYFNLSKAEIIRRNLREMSLKTDGEPDVDAFQAQLQAIINSKSGRVIMDTFEDIIREAYGERGEDNITFHKSPELSARFMNTNAYEVLFLELCTDAGAASAFINGIMPKSLDLPAGDDRSVDLQARIDEITKSDKHIAFPEPRTALGLVKDPAEMSHAELVAALKAKTSGGGE